MLIELPFLCLLRGLPIAQKRLWTDKHDWLDMYSLDEPPIAWQQEYCRAESCSEQRGCLLIVGICSNLDRVFIASGVMTVNIL